MRQTRVAQLSLLVGLASAPSLGSAQGSTAGAPAPPPASSAHPATSASAPAPPAPSSSPPAAPPSPGSPAQGYPPPAQGYPPPAQGYPPPAQGYPPPAQGYPPPAQGYPPPAQGYPPAWGYPPPAYGKPAPPVELKRPRRHEGFLLDLALGAFYGKIGFESVSGRKAKITGWGPALEVLVGSSPWPGIVLGGGLLYAEISKPRVERDGEVLTERYQTYLMSIAIFTSVYPDPSLGWHVLGLVGAGVGRVAPKSSTDDSHDPTGLTLGIGGGWEGYVSNKWSLGGRLRFTYAAFKNHQIEGNNWYRTLMPGANFIVTWQ